jgi:hypothetical protein
MKEESSLGKQKCKLVQIPWDSIGGRAFIETLLGLFKRKICARTFEVVVLSASLTGL